VRVVFSLPARQTGKVTGKRWLVALCWFAWVAPAGAAVPIEWEAPQGCPGTDFVLTELEQALGHGPAELGSVSRVRGVVVAAGSGAVRYRLTLELVDAGARSSRSFEAERCEDLARAAALAVALAVHARPGESEAGAAAASGATLTVVTEMPEEPAAADHRRDPEDEAAGSRPVSWSAGAGAVLDVGALPDPAAGIGVGARLAMAPFELDVSGVFLPSQRQAVGAGDSVEFGLMAAGLRACLRLLDRSLVVAGCVAGEAGQLAASGVGLRPERDVHDVWLAAGPAVLARTAFAGPLQLELMAEPLLPLARKQYAVNATDVVHSPSVVDLRVQLWLIIGAAGGGGG
jgi:hypothetical protein